MNANEREGHSLLETVSKKRLPSPPNAGAWPGMFLAGLGGRVVERRVSPPQDEARRTGRQKRAGMTWLFSAIFES